MRARILAAYECSLFHGHVHTRGPSPSTAIPGFGHNVVLAGSHLQVSIESFAVLLVLQPVIDVNLNRERSARAGYRSVNMDRRNDSRVGRRGRNREYYRQHVEMDAMF